VSLKEYFKFELLLIYLSVAFYYIGFPFSVGFWLLVDEDDYLPLLKGLIITICTLPLVVPFLISILFLIAFDKYTLQNHFDWSVYFEN
jgi:hypothetical protein